MGDFFELSPENIFRLMLVLRPSSLMERLSTADFIRGPFVGCLASISVLHRGHSYKVVSASFTRRTIATLQTGQVFTISFLN